MGLVGINGVLRQGMFAPGICTTYTVDISIDVEIDETTTLDFIGMGRPLKVFLAIVPGSDTEGTIAGIDAEISDFEPADVASVAVVLWMEIISLVCR